MEVSKKHTNCRVCGSAELIKYFDAGWMPLANNNTATKDESLDTEEHLLQVLFCNECGLSQLSVVVDPVVMFANYDYRSAVNAGYVKHCKEMAVQLKNKYNLTEDSFHIDIAGNDGTLLKQFQNEIGLTVLNVDPAENLTAIAEMNGVDCITDFWSTELAEFFVLGSNFKADLITATNVFAHVDNVNDFINASKIALQPNGVLILEFPYLVDFIEKMEFDTIYHEHLSYFSVLPLMRLCSVNGMVITCIEKFSIHGGSLRVIIAHEDSKHLIESSVSKFVNNELKLGYNKIEKYLNWSEKVSTIVFDFKNQLLNIKNVAAFAASAKGNTLLNFCEINHTDLLYIADETPEKIGKFYSGTGIQIVNKSEIVKNPPDYIIILSWNFKTEIIEKVKKLGYKGKFIIPIPNFEIID